MKRHYWILIILVLLALTELSFALYSTGIMLPIMLIILASIITIENIVEFRKLKSGSFLSIRPDKKGFFTKIVTVIMGIALVLWGILKSPKELSFMGLDYFFYIGLLMIYSAFVSRTTYLFLFTQKFIRHKDLGIFGDRKYSNIDKIEISQATFKIFYNSELIVYNLKDSNERQRIIDFLKPKMRDRLVIL